MALPQYKKVGRTFDLKRCVECLVGFVSTYKVEKSTEIVFFGSLILNIPFQVHRYGRKIMYLETLSTEIEF